MEKTNYDIIDSLHRGDVLSRDEWMSLLSSLNADEREYLRSKAQEVAVAHYGKGVFVRALLEISSYCKNNCYYCGIRASNRSAQRYRLTKEEIMECCKEADRRRPSPDRRMGDRRGENDTSSLSRQGDYFIRRRAQRGGIRRFQGSGREQVSAAS